MLPNSVPLSARKFDSEVVDWNSPFTTITVPEGLVN
jgi:hypothetical protein